MTYFSKVESAKILLEDSIDNYFNNKITPSAFLLAWNARRILRDLLKKKWQISASYKWVQDNTDTNIDDIEKDLREHSNFFKHSDRKNDEIKQILCTEWMLEIILYDTVFMYKQFVWESTHKMKRFTWYWNFTKRDDIPDKDMQEKMYGIIKVLWKVPTKLEFYNL